MNKIRNFIAKYKDVLSYALLFGFLAFFVVGAISIFKNDKNNVKVVYLKKNQKYYMPKNSHMMPLLDIGIIKHKDGTETRIVPQGNGFVYPYEDALVIKQAKQMLKAKYIKKADFKKLVHKCYENDDDISYSELKKFNHKNVVDKHGFEYKIHLADDLSYNSEKEAYKLKHVMNPRIYKRNNDYLKVKRSDN